MAEPYKLPEDPIQAEIEQKLRQMAAADDERSSSRTPPANDGNGPQPPGLHLRHNEKVELTASFLNIVAAVMFTAAIVAPAASYMYASNTSDRPWWQWIGGAVLWLVGGISLHFASRRVLERLRQ